MKAKKPPRPQPGPLQVTIQIPAADSVASAKEIVVSVPAAVAGNVCCHHIKVICAKGNASRPSETPVKVYLRVYPGKLDPGTGPGQVPSSPTGQGASTVTPTGNDWFIAQIGDVQASQNPEYPWNTLAAWAQFDDAKNPFDLQVTHFQGHLTTQTDCEEQGLLA